MADRTVTGGQRGEPGMRVIASAADPLAELARLRRPSGPWLHLLDGAPSDARQLGWMLAQDGVVVRILRGHCVRTSYGLFDEAAAALQLPGDPVEDWPTLAGLLTDMSWLPGAGHLLVVTRASLLLAAEQPSNVDGLVLAVREVARGRAEEGEPVPFHLVLQDDTIGLAALRPRLEAAGARYDELAGWDAEEPFAESTGNPRIGYTRGEVALDAADTAVVSVLSTWDGVVEVRRAWETFRGPDTARVRMYLPLLAEDPPGPVLRGIVGAVSIAARNAGAVGLAMPMPVNEARRDPRQQAAVAASVPLWPTPEPVPAPDAAATDTIPAAPARSDVDAAPRRAEPPAAPAAGDAERPADVPEPSGVDTAAPLAPVPAGAEPPAGTPDPPDGDAAHDPRHDGPAPAAATGDAADPGDPAARDARQRAADAQSDQDASTTGPSDVDSQEPAADQPLDDPAGTFELVAANLEWDFAAGADEADPVDAALVRHAGTSGRLVALFRTWVKDPGGGWVRVVMEYVGSGSIADVETERSTAVELLRRAGGKRCCVEVIGASDVSDVHEWLQERSVTLWTAQPRIPEPRTAPDLGTSTVDSDAAGPEPARPADVPSISSPAPAWPADVPSVSSPEPSAAADVASVATPADVPSVSAPSSPAPSTRDAPLPAAAAFEPGPEDTEMIARLLDWAPDQAGLIGLVSAWTEVDGTRTLVIGVVMEPDADHDALRAAAADLVQGEARTESIVPAKGLPPLLLRLYRSSTRLWTRKVKREAAATPPGTYKSGDVGGVSGDISNVLGEAVVMEDVHLPGGFTIVAIDAETQVRKGQSEPDWTDAAVVASVQDQPHLLAAVRGTTKRGDGDMAVYGILVDETADRAAIRTSVATVIADGGATRAAVEVFCPFERIDVLHLNLYENGLALWKRQREEAPPPEAAAAP